jgi:hypothetical protein
MDVSKICWNVKLTTNEPLSPQSYIYSCTRCGYTFECGLNITADDEYDTCNLQKLILNRVCLHEQYHHLN